MELLLKITDSQTLTADELSAFRDKAIQGGQTAESLLTSMIRNAIKPAKKKGARAK